MLFNSFEFLVFFPVVVIAYFVMPYRFRWLLLLLASYIFYMAWEPVYVLLVIASTIVDYFVGIMLGRVKSRGKRLSWLCTSLIVNLGLLFFFKYFNFFSSSLGSVFDSLGFPARLPESRLLLPIGISFYTFQTLSYTVEVYRGKQEPQKHPGIFALYVAFFPQLVAGPIERAGNLLPQLLRKHDFDYARITSGLKLMAWGMLKKVVIADRLAEIVDAVYGNPQNNSGPALIVATVFFAFQIYCDFSGYSDIAIGAAQVMGIKLMDNFKRPYFAKSVSEFWRRWHISLSTWFRDYLYISLGGNRVSIPKWYINIAIVFLLSGLWHGANWTFVIWGALHGIYLLLSHLLNKPTQSIIRLLGMDKTPFLLKVIQVLFTFTLVNIGWIFFRSSSLSDAIYIVTHLFTGWSALVNITELKLMFIGFGVTKSQFLISLVSVVCLLIIQLYQRQGSIRDRLDSKPALIRWFVYYVLILIIIFFGVFGENQFIYFQF